MVVKFLLEGKVKDKSVEAFIAEYAKRLKPYFDFELLEMSCNSKQFDKMYNSSTPKDLYIGLDVLGKRYDSHKFATWLDNKRHESRSITFIIGEAEGLSDKARSVITEYISLSDMTFSYRVSLVVLSEQIYRAMTIVTGHPYHK